MTPARRRSQRGFTTAVLTAVLLGTTAPQALAQDPVPPGPPGGTTEFSSRSLGFGPSIDFRGHSDIVTLSVPVPDGLTPQAYDTVAQLPADVARGSLDVESDGRLLTRVDLPPGAESVPLSIPLDAATVQNGFAVITLDLTLRGLDNICPESWAFGSVRLLDGTVRYTGTPAQPTVVADYLPRVLERLELFLPAEPTDAEATVALDLAAAVTARYAGRQVPLRVLEVPDNGIPPAADDPFVRQIVIREDEEAGTEIGTVPGGPPALYVRGDAESVQDQGRMLTSVISGFAVDGQVAIGPLTIPPILAPDSTTLFDLGVSDTETSALGIADVHLFLDQAEFGRAAHDISVDLQGSYTPLPDTRGGLITVSAGDVQLDAWATDDTGIIDRTITIPDSSLGRVTDVTVALTTTGGQQLCGLEQPVTLRIDGNSVVESSPADSPVPAGFGSLPQTLMPQLNVATTGGTLIDISRAVELVAGLQSLTARPLDPTWVPLDEALASPKPAVIVAANGLVPEEIDLPLVRTEDRRFQVSNADGESTTLTFGTEVDFASLQVVQNDERTMLVATSTGVPEELDRTLMWLAADPDRWFELDGRILFTAPDRDPVALADPRENPDADADASSETDGAVVAVVIAGAALLVLGVAAVATGAFLRRRHRRRPR